MHNFRLFGALSSVICRWSVRPNDPVSAFLSVGFASKSAAAKAPAATSLVQVVSATDDYAATSLA